MCMVPNGASSKAPAVQRTRVQQASWHFCARFLDATSRRAASRHLSLWRLVPSSVWKAAALALAFVATPFAFAQTYVTPTSPFTGTSGATGNAVFTFPGQGITATVSVNSAGVNRYSIRNTATTGDGALGTQTLSTIGAVTNAMLTSATTTTPAVYLDIGGFGCAVTLGVEQTCTDRGTITITFSQPVSNPRLHFTGLGTTGTAALGRFHAYFQLTGSSPSGATLSALSGNSIFSTSGTTITNSQTITSVSSLCNSTPQQAACGSVQVNGTNITSLTFSANLRYRLTAGGWPNNNATSELDGHMLGISLAQFADLAITKTNGQTNYAPGQAMTYTMVVSNAGPNSANGAVFTDANVANFNEATVTCGAATGGAACPLAANTTIALMQGAGIVIPTLPSGGSLTFTVTGTVAAAASGNLTNTASIAAPVGVTDSDTANNSATDSDLLQPSFGTCDARMYLDQVSTAQNPNVATLLQVGYGSTPFTYTALGSGLARNALGYSAQDNYIYGIEWDGALGNELIRVGSDGSSVNLGVVSGLPSASYAAGVIGSTGDYYVTAGGTALYRINIATRTASLVTMGQSINVFDLVWYNGLLYAINSNTGQLISINPATGAVTTIGSSAPVTTSIAMWGFNNAILAYYRSSDNTISGIYAIDPASGAATLLSNAPLTNNADGANCPTASIQFNADLAVTKTNTPTSGPNDLSNDTYAPGEVRTYTIVVSNNSTSFGAQNVTVSDPVPAGVDPSTVSWTCTSTSGGARCGAASGSGALNDVGLDLPATINGGQASSVTYLVTMTVPAGFAGDLSNTVTITPPSTINDGNTANNTATDTDASAPLLTIRKISIGGVDSFGFTGTNGVATQTLVTATAGAPISGATQALTTAATATTITESTTPTTYRVTDITCTGLGTGGTATPDLANRVVSLDAAATAAGANIVCTFTNTLQQADIQVVKTAAPSPVVSGDVVTYTLVVSNNGPNAVTNALLSDVPSAGQTCTTPSTTATCTATGGASCPSPTVPVSSLLGAGITIPTLPVGGQVTVTLQCTVNASGQ